MIAMPWQCIRRLIRRLRLGRATMKNAALVVGIDHYAFTSGLTGCVNDARAIHGLLDRHDSGAVNFDCYPLMSTSATMINGGAIRTRLQALFTNKDIDIALFYFAGHGSRQNGFGYLCASDVSADNPGIPFEEVLGLANNSPAKHRFIILDCCHAGAIGDLIATRTPAPLAEGVAILAACREDQTSAERNGRGVFTSHICNALDGGAADVQGTVTIASLYSYVDEMLSAWSQRPLFRASLASFAPLRRASAAMTDDKLRKLASYFPAADFEYPLDPSYEPTHASRNDAHVEIFSILQQSRAARLVEPVGTPHMYYAAVESRSCKLTPLGKFYWQKVADSRL